MPPITNAPIYFGPFLVTSQVFHLTPHSFALVNLKPLLPGHVLISPRRKAPRISDLTPVELTDLFSTVQRVGRMVERVFSASALNIAIQDGAAAGQSVPHIHTHVIPRKAADLDERGGGDVVYTLLEGQEGDVGRHLLEREVRDRPKFPAVGKDEERRPRTEEVMRREAEWLAGEMEKESRL
ncbi:MAG: hypothetical protein M1835_003331 [Candelina submexicana]|nr:MAG: hypothetical protein M1835_003331 [Candelina submexicana]